MKRRPRRNHTPAFKDITHPDDRDRDRELLRHMVAGELAVFDVENRFIRKDGNVVWARVTANVIRDGSGRPLRNTAVILDINARKQAEQALQASKARLQLAMNAAQLGWWQYDPRHRVFSGDTRSKEISMLPLTRRRSRRSRSGCIRTTRKGFGRLARRRSLCDSCRALQSAYVGGVQ